MIPAREVQYVDMSDVLRFIPDLANVNTNADNRDEFYNILDRYITWGDASYVMMGNNIFLEALYDFFSSRETPLEKIKEIYWSVVPENAYINVAG